MADEDDFSWVGRFNIGDRVRVARGDRAPAFGWGGVTVRSVGTIVSMNDNGSCVVNFGGRDSRWNGMLGELISADAPVRSTHAFHPHLL
jgi:hypothetical protein